MDSEKHGLSFWEVLQLIFIVLKLTGVIQWSWLWVLSPLWIYFIIVIVVSIWISINR